MTPLGWFVVVLGCLFVLGFLALRSEAAGWKLTAAKVLLGGAAIFTACYGCIELAPFLRPEFKNQAALALERSLGESQREIQSLRQELSTALSALRADALKTRQEQAQALEQRLSHERASFEERLAKAEHERQQTKEELAALRADTLKAQQMREQAQQAKAREEQAALNAELERTRNELQQTKTALEEARLGAIREEFADLSSDVTAMVTQFRKEKESWSQQITSLFEEIAKLRTPPVTPEPPAPPVLPQEEPAPRPVVHDEGKEEQTQAPSESAKPEPEIKAEEKPTSPEVPVEQKPTPVVPDAKPPQTNVEAPAEVTPPAVVPVERKAPTQNAAVPKQGAKPAQPAYRAVTCYYYVWVGCNCYELRYYTYYVPVEPATCAKPSPPVTVCPEQRYYRCDRPSNGCWFPFFHR